MIKPVTRKDKEVFTSLMREFYNSHAVLHPLPDGMYDRVFQALLRSAVGRGYLIADNDQNTAGYAVVSSAFSVEAGGEILWIEDIYLRPEFRGKGLAKEFFAFAESSFPSACRLRLEVEKSNLSAVALYRRLGFTELDYMQMIKDLDSKD